MEYYIIVNIILILLLNGTLDKQNGKIIGRARDDRKENDGAHDRQTGRTLIDVDVNADVRWALGWAVELLLR